MFVDHRSSFFSTLFTFLKLGVAVVVLVLLASKFSQLWQSNSGQETVRESIQKMFPEQQ
jgi:hypothetical protein